MLANRHWPLLSAPSSPHVHHLRPEEITIPHDKRTFTGMWALLFRARDAFPWEYLVFRLFLSPSISPCTVSCCSSAILAFPNCFCSSLSVRQHTPQGRFTALYRLPFMRLYESDEILKIRKVIEIKIVCPTDRTSLKSPYFKVFCRFQLKTSPSFLTKNSAFV